MYFPYKLSNASQWHGIPTIEIYFLNSGWPEIYQKWLKGENPTNSPEWKKGIILHSYPASLDSCPTFAGGCI